MKMQAQSNTPGISSKVQHEVIKKTIPNLLAVKDEFEEYKESESEATPEIINDLEEQIKAARVLFTEEVMPDPVAITINQNGEQLPFATLGNFSAIIGKAKSKKTFLTLLFLAAAVRKTIQPEFINGELPKHKKRVVWFDTEQARFHLRKGMQRLSTLLQSEGFNNVEVYDLRPYSPAERTAIINYVLTDANLNNDIGLVIIDGIRDLVSDINNPDEATAVATKLLKWTANKGLHIICVLHQNKADNNARGHLGTEIINKAETVISVTKDTGNPLFSIVSPEFCRGRDFQPFAFTINEAGLPIIADDFTTGSASIKEKKFDPFKIDPELHHKVLQVSLNQADGLGYKSLQSMLKVHWAAFGQKIGDTATQDLITYYHHKMKWIDHNGKSGKAAKYLYNGNCTTLTPFIDKGAY